MDLNYLKKILKIFDQSTLTDLTIEEEGIKISLSRKIAEVNNIVQPTPEKFVQPTQISNEPAVEPVVKKVEPEVSSGAIASTYHKITSPIVGTFYRAPSPESEPFVEVGSHVIQGQTLCIVEAMKVMNEIESDVAGTVVEILVENGKPVEYNQTLMLIKPD